MKFFVDTADLAEIEEAASWGVLAGVTTNPSLYAKIGGRVADFPAHIQRICKVTKGPVSAEAISTCRDDIIREGRQLAALAPNVVVKIPVSTAGLAACRVLADECISVNMTLIFSVPQAVMAARAGARFLSPFVGRFDDIGGDGIGELQAIIDALTNYDWRDAGIAEPVGGSLQQAPEIIAASIRTVQHVSAAALVGADIATVPFNVLRKCLEHPLTSKGMEAFVRDWEKVSQA
ncbi:MAG: fructose-6-phosphate aldolase [Actinomycetia bacterium]|nr:fructose-6-phosphate aldolase [Actinomycetes bacterium]